MATPRKMNWKKKVSERDPRHFYTRTESPILIDFDITQIADSIPMKTRNSINWLCVSLGITAKDLSNLLNKSWFIQPKTTDTPYAIFERWQSELIIAAFNYAREEMELLSETSIHKRNAYLKSFIETNMEVFKNHEFIDV